jgi:predicted metal-dependent phosphoesterase TrpH
MMSLKAELHAHSSEDPMDELSYDIYKLIDHAKSLNYDVLAITLHERVLEGKEFLSASRYAKSKGILLIPGCEAMIEGKHVLLYNIKDSERKKIMTFNDLRVFKKNIQKTKREILIIAPHPYFYITGSTHLGQKLLKNIDLFDAIEYHYFYSKIFNLNIKAVKMAKQYKKPMVGDCDVHFLDAIGSTYSLINSQYVTINSVIKAIKKGRVKVKTIPINTSNILVTGLKHFFNLHS